MKRYLKEIIILIIKLIMFYFFLLKAGPTDVMGMIIILIMFVFIVSMIMGAVSKEKIKYLYPIIVSVLFIPSIFIYYNESALIHAVWYLIVSILGIIIGTIINKILNKYNRL